MEKYLDAFINAFTGTVNWTWKSIIFEVPWYTNYFWGLIVISLFVWGLEIVFPWRKQQSIFRRDFWLDAFYMFFNFFVFSIVISGVYKILGLIFSEFDITTKSLALFDISQWSPWLQLLVFFVILDFVQWFTHVLLHKYAFLWKFHKVHHSVKEMGFAAHLRYHWMENILNNPVMHLYHHAYIVPEGRNGMNYGISLSLWDYIFKTNYIPEDSGTVEIGFKGDDKFPTSFVDQNLYGFKKGQN